MSESQAKINLRAEMRAHLRAMNPAARAEASLLICRTAAGHPAFRAARRPALFAPLASEPDIHPLIEETWAQGKRVALPFLREGGPRPELDWHEVADWSDLAARGPMNLREPDPMRCPRVARDELDAVFVPGLAFDAQGHRLGRGGGFYDSFLADLPRGVACIGLFFALQQVARVPRAVHDHPLQRVITEAGEIICSGGL
ncbi:MAG: 5-formyltetrahydrofolate cyclo-ligase [Verrucomicrobiota bacterium]